MRMMNYSGGNDIALLRSGAEFFPAMIAAIDQAHAEIYLETYIFSIDDTGIQVRDALVRAAARGVEVSVISDWHGTGRLETQQLKHSLLETAVQHRSFNPWFRRGVARSHRKLCVIDRSVGFVGGININDDFFSDEGSRKPLPAPRWDFAVRIRGPLVEDLHREAQAQWIRIGKMKLRARWDRFRSSHLTPGGQNATSGAQAALVVRDNLRHRRTIERAYLHALGRARHSALLANPYFAPGRKLRRGLEEAARRGVKVTLLLGVGQFDVQDAVAKSFYPKLLKAGVQIVEYTKSQLHAKVAVIDDQWTTVGSSNYDGLSLFINQEANVVINDATFAATLRAEIEAGTIDGRVVQLQDYLHIPWHKRCWYGMAFLLYRLVIGVITLGRDA
ncbi:cardiolipin synthase [Herbaspirillum sp. Sphag1AN]|uniref:cardiolipin synthase ClsB n=1 Tax=unclassified Herbaspirillum TaxID=2624150 RepID=UPI0016230E14|nr:MULTISPECIES: cardiolipin synthase ClsB [unclassified Herbaspirillum]MBB3214829.1 cardiolipin synthase [Herbaspirillum sp. Sphag1AN]MBB3248023.1 cardiolipin synthase [Herbaspirillum sp. Sphag64]